MIVLLDLWFDWSIDTWPLVMSSLIGLSCALLGTVFLLRRSALLGDAVSHSVLPGIAFGLFVHGLFFKSGEDEEAFGVSSSLVFILLGALLAGLLVTLFIETLHRLSRIQPDTALGAVFPAFFAVGIIAIEVLASGAHLDADCVFYGSLEVIGSFEQVLPSLGTAALVIAFFFLAYREILATSFDPIFSRSIGLRRGLVNNSLVALLAATVVCAFEAVGAILVIAFLVVPPATAYLLTDRFHHMLIIASLLGVGAGVVGSWLTVFLEHLGFATGRAPTVALVAGGFFMIAFLFGPERGALAQYLRHLRLERRILDENFLGALYRLASAPLEEARASRPVSLAEVADYLRYTRARLAPALVREKRRAGVIDHGDGTISLTAEGRERVETIVIRAHRLWESYMTRELGAAPDHVHEMADHIEHYLRPTLLDELDRLLDRPRTDPHGSSIPG